MAPYRPVSWIYTTWGVLKPKVKNYHKNEPQFAVPQRCSNCRASLEVNNLNPGHKGTLNICLQRKLPNTAMSHHERASTDNNKHQNSTPKAQIIELTDIHYKYFQMIKDEIEPWEDNTIQWKKKVDLGKVKLDIKNSFWNKNREEVKQKIRDSQRKS